MNTICYRVIPLLFWQRKRKFFNLDQKFQNAEEEILHYKLILDGWG